MQLKNTGFKKQQFSSLHSIYVDILYSIKHYSIQLHWEKEYWFLPTRLILHLILHNVLKHLSHTSDFQTWNFNLHYIPVTVYNRSVDMYLSDIFS